MSNQDVLTAGSHNYLKLSLLFGYTLREMGGSMVAIHNRQMQFSPDKVRAYPDYNLQVIIFILAK